MKIKCIDNNAYEEQLTVGEIYYVEIEFEYSSTYMLIDDQGLLKSFPKDLFEIW